MDYMPDSVKRKVCKITRIFTYLASLKELKDNKTIRGSSTTPWKICVRPFQPKQKPISSTDSGIKSWFYTNKEKSSKDYYIYFYDEVKGGMGTSIGYKLPGHIVKNTLKLLEEREDKDEAQLMQQEMTETMKLESGDQVLMSPAMMNKRRKSAISSPKPQRKGSFANISSANAANLDFHNNPLKNDCSNCSEKLGEMKDMMEKMMKSIELMKSGMERNEGSQL